LTIDREFFLRDAVMFDRHNLNATVMNRPGFPGGSFL
jgi:hypothetical protein